MGVVAVVTAALALVLVGCSAVNGYTPSVANGNPTTAASQTASSVTSPTVEQQGTPSTPPSATRGTGASVTPTQAASKNPHAPSQPTVKPLVQTPTMIEYSLNTSISQGGSNTVTISCPQGAFALGGGWSVPGKDARVYAASVSGNSWVVRVQSLLGFGVGIPITVYVECLSNVTSATVTQNTKSASIATGNSSNAQAVTCTSGFPVGYGFDLSSSAINLELMATNPETFESAVWWNFWIRNHDSVARQVSVSVVCLSDVTAVSAGGVQPVDVLPSFPGKQGTYVYASMTGTVTASCPVGMQPAGGSLDYGNLPNIANVGIGNISSLHAVGGGWQGSIYGVTGVGLYPLIPVAWAVCVSFS